MQLPDPPCVPQHVIRRMGVLAVRSRNRELAVTRLCHRVMGLPLKGRVTRDPDRGDIPGAVHDKDWRENAAYRKVWCWTMRATVDAQQALGHASKANRQVRMAHASTEHENVEQVELEAA